MFYKNNDLILMNNQETIILLQRDGGGNYDSSTEITMLSNSVPEIFIPENNILYRKMQNR